MAQAAAVCASETTIGGAYVAVVTEAAPALPEIADVEEEAELADEAPIAPPGTLAKVSTNHAAAPGYSANGASARLPPHQCHHNAASCSVSPYMPRCGLGTLSSITQAAQHLICSTSA